MALAQHPESRWTHPLCDDCAAVVIHPGRTPSRVMGPDREACCRCGQPTESGIFYRGDAFLMNLSSCPMLLRGVHL